MQLPPLTPSISPPPLAVFDSRLQELTLPILPVVVGDPGMAEEEEEGGPGHRHSKVSSAVERYFDLIGRVEVGESVSTKHRSEWKIICTQCLSH